MKENTVHPNTQVIDQQTTHPEAGFTLLEVLVAVAVMSIGILAMVAIQGVYIRGASTAHDSAQASVIAQRGIEAIRTEATMWTNYSPTPNAATQPGLTSMLTNLGTWQPLFNGFPVNETTLATNTSYGDGRDLRSRLNARFCVEARVDWFENPISLSGQVRVVWPNANSNQTGISWVKTPAEATVSCASVAGGGNLDSLLYNAGVPNTDYSVVYMPFFIRRQNL